MSKLQIPYHAMPAATPTALLDAATEGVANASGMQPGSLAYATAHLAALRAAAAVVAARCEPLPRGVPTQVRPVWEIVREATPELREWAEFFARGAVKRAAAEAGIPRAVTAAEADEVVRSASTFVGLVRATLGIGAEVAA